MDDDLGDRWVSEAPRPHISIVPEPTAPSCYQEDHRRATFEDFRNWLQLNVEIDPQWTVLEFGVGKYGFSQFYRNLVKHIIGLDIHDYSSFHPDIEFVLSDGDTIPLPDEAVDLVVSHSVLEHVSDVRRSIKEIDRVLKIGGFAFLTVSPLYYSASGSHVNSPSPLANWEHLDPRSPYYQLELVNNYDNLNKLTSQEMLAAVGSVPWDILRYEIRPEHKIAPDFALQSGIPHLDLYTREFRLIAHRRTRITARGQFQDPPHPYLRGNAAGTINVADRHSGLG